MLTPLPFPSFIKTAACLRDQDLQAARIDTLEILRTILHKEENNHPCVRMWMDYAPRLINYGQILCLEWITRGNQDRVLDQIATLQKLTIHTPHNDPWWLYLPALSRSHQATLLARDRPHYKPWFDANNTMLLVQNEPLFWPVGPKLTPMPF